MEFQETILTVPASVAENSVGLALDIGGSIAKAIYRSKEEYDNGKPKGGKASDSGKLRLVKAPRSNLDDLLAYLRKRGDLVRSDENAVFTTGLGGNSYRESLREKLDTRTENVMEFSCCAKAFHFLSKHYTPEELFYPLSSSAVDALKKIMSFFEKFREMAKTQTDSMMDLPDESPSLSEAVASQEDKDDNLFPCLLVLAGSAVPILKIEEDGSFTLIERGFYGGTMFVGMASALTGVSDFATLMSMAERGDRGRSSTVDMYGGDLKGEDGDDLYATMPDDWMIFPFGKCVTSPIDEIDKDDLVFSLLQVTCMDIAQFSHLRALTEGVHKMYFCGGFVDNPLARTIMSKTLLMRNFNRDPLVKPLKFEFLRNSGYFGALGAYLQSLPA